MPLYDIQCTCGNKQEILLKLDQKTPLCPKCGHQMKKMMSATTFILKGSGWAKDGYRLHKTKNTKGKENG